MTSKLRGSLPPREFRERYIMRRLLCEYYFHSYLPRKQFIYNYIFDKEYIGGVDRVINHSIINNIKKKVFDDGGFYDYKWVVEDDVTMAFDKINNTQGVDIEYIDEGVRDGKNICIFNDFSLERGMISIIKIGFPEHFVMAIIEPIYHTLHVTMIDPSSLFYNRRHLEYETPHRLFRHHFSRWIREHRTYYMYEVKYEKPRVNLSFQFEDDYNCQTWVYYYIHIVYLDSVTKHGSWEIYFNKLKELGDCGNLFHIRVSFNLLLEEFIYFMINSNQNEGVTIFNETYPFHYKLYN